jgi:hypothetical protein
MFFLKKKILTYEKLYDILLFSNSNANKLKNIVKYIKNINNLNDFNQLIDLILLKISEYELYYINYYFIKKYNLIKKLNKKVKKINKYEGYIKFYEFLSKITNIYENINELPEILFIDICNQMNYVININNDELFISYFKCIEDLSYEPRNYFEILKHMMKINDYEMLKNPKIYKHIVSILSNICIMPEYAYNISESEIYLEIFKKWEIVKTKSNMLNLSIKILMNNTLCCPKQPIYLFHFPLYEDIIDEKSDRDMILYHIKNKYEIKSFQTSSSLHLAYKYGDIESVLYKIIYKSININQIDRIGNTILHNAILNLDYESIKLLIILNCNYDIKNMYNDSALSLYPQLIYQAIKIKEKFIKSYKNGIKKELKYNEINNYEKDICNIIYSYMNISNDIWNYISTTTTKDISYI